MLMFNDLTSSALKVHQNTGRGEAERNPCLESSQIYKCRRYDRISVTPVGGSTHSRLIYRGFATLHRLPVFSSALRAFHIDRNYLSGVSLRSTACL